MSYKIAFIGLGKLGMPCAEVMATKYDIVGYDIVQPENSQIPIKQSIEEVMKDRDIIFVAVPTPHKPGYDGSTPITTLWPEDFDYGAVINVLTEINKFVTDDQLIVLISTVLPGTVRKQFIPLLTKGKFVYNPYLIAMGSVKWDMVNPECLIIGTEDGTMTGPAKQLIEFYQTLMNNSPRINVGTWDEAEATKIFYNTFISAKIGLVNMIQDVAEKNGNINVDIVTDALKNATQRITGPRYLTAGMGDAGACHPRDNIALRWLSNELDIGYDLFHAIMHSRDMQAKNMAKRLEELSIQYRLPVIIHGRAYKPQVEYTIGSYSELVGSYLKESQVAISYVDPLTCDTNYPSSPAIFLMAHDPGVTYAGTGLENEYKYTFYCDIPKGSVILDPWRKITKMEGIKVIHYGNPRFNG